MQLENVLNFKLNSSRCFRTVSTVHPTPPHPVQVAVVSPPWLWPTPAVSSRIPPTTGSTSTPEQRSLAARERWGHHNCLRLPEWRPVSKVGHLQPIHLYLSRLCCSLGELQVFWPDKFCQAKHLEDKIFHLYIDRIWNES